MKESGLKTNSRQAKKYSYETYRKGLCSRVGQYRSVENITDILWMR